VLDCPEVSQAFSAGGDLLGDESMRAIARAWEASTLRLAGEGIDLDGYTMPEVIEDNEAVRKALGYSRINLKSGSYGTRVAYLYGLRHPASIHRTAMIAVNPPGRFVWEPRETDAIVRRYSALWARDPVLSRKSPDLYATMRSVLTNMPRRWFFLSIDPARVRVVTAALLFDRGTAAMVFDAYVAAEQGDPSGLALMSVAYDWAVPSSMHWGDLYAKAVGADFDSTRNYCRDMEPPNLPLGSPMSKLLWGPLDYFRRPPRLLPQEYRQRQRSDVETLLLSGSLDVSTPAEYATNELLPCLRNGRQIVIAESGHQNLETLQPENARRILSGFFETGVPDESLRSYVPMDFNVRWGFPIMAKGALGILVLLGSAAVALVVWLVRRVW
jgi:pimeloyl-ACP methyl ester carboxylesterase